MAEPVRARRLTDQEGSRRKGPGSRRPRPGRTRDLQRERQPAQPLGQVAGVVVAAQGGVVA
jgi:hypothetical protein